MREVIFWIIVTPVIVVILGAIVFFLVAAFGPDPKQEPGRVLWSMYTARTPRLTVEVRQANPAVSAATMRVWKRGQVVHVETVKVAHGGDIRDRMAWQSTFDTWAYLNN